jgi:rRNA processing protein Krr1/Pno1
MGKKLNSKNDLTLAPTSNLSRFRLKINKNTGTILGKFRTWNMTKSTIEVLMKKHH